MTFQNDIAQLVLCVVLAYLVGSVPSAYIIVRIVTGGDITKHGSGNVGAMNVRRTTGSWWWFIVAMLADAMKGAVPVAVAKAVAVGSAAHVAMPVGTLMAVPELQQAAWLSMSALAGTVIGHNYSCWMALIAKRFRRTGKGLATGGGGLLVYDWRYFVAALAVGLLVIAVTRYMMAGQVSAAFALPATALLLGSRDWPFAVAIASVVYAAHHRRFIGLLKGEEPRLYVNDRMGPRG